MELSIRTLKNSRKCTKIIKKFNKSGSGTSQINNMIKSKQQERLFDLISQNKIKVEIVKSKNKYAHIKSNIPKHLRDKNGKTKVIISS